VTWEGNLPEFGNFPPASVIFVSPRDFTAEVTFLDFLCRKPVPFG
jgi:hypothetical protein